jgi:glycosyltransferase involved in cell wall biosynthesis
MPTFDRLQFLPPAIESVFAQTLTDWELIIADDGSGEDARAYLRSLADPRLRVLWMTHSGRPSVALNAALRAARGQYVAFLDSDDVWLPRKLERQVATLKRNPGRRWSCTAFALIDAAGCPLVAARTSWPAPSGWVRERLLTDAVIATPSVVVERSLLEQVGPLDEELVMNYEGDLWLRLAAVSELDGVDEPLTLVRRHGLHSGSDILAWQDLRRVVEKALRATDDAHFATHLREQRAVISAGLARSHAAFGTRADAMRTLAESAPYSLRYLKWWRHSAHALARAFAPRVVRTAVRALRTRVPSRELGTWERPGRAAASPPLTEHLRAGQQ